ncbi:MAG TPA: site-specific integrase, partial [Candidatus Polarisedimenticolia bacterium]|nr:site-specific integrase [Candidatus Polarisedimenticolia bacterium]
PIPPLVTEARTVKDLLDTHYRDLRLNGRKTVDYWHHSRRIFERFGPMSPREVRVIHIEAYKQERLEAGAKPATVNVELAVLRRAFKLGQQLELIERAPFVRMLRVENARQGFLSADEYHKLRSTLEALSPPVADALVIWFCLGWRRREVLGLTWSEVDLKAETIRLPASRSKNHQPRPVKVGQGILEALRRRWADRRGDHVFHRRGIPIRDFRGPWKRATAAIGRPELFVHDLRRSYAKAALEAGLSTTDIMALAGWTTLAMFLRYGLLFDGKRLGEQVAVRDAHVARAKEAGAWLRKADGSFPVERPDQTRGGQDQQPGPSPSATPWLKKSPP